MLLFDMDGTLIDSNGIWKNIDRAFLKRRGLPYTHAYYQGVAHTAFPKAAQFTKDYCNLSESCEEIMAEWMDLATHAYDDVTIKPGVRAYLKQCKAQGRSMAVVTSSIPVHCHAALQHLNLMKYFDRITFAQELGLDKGQPDIWLYAAKEAGVKPQDCTVFDDSVAACSGARLAKMRVVGVYDHHFETEQKHMRQVCDIYLKSFEELLYTN